MKNYYIIKEIWQIIKSYLIDYKSIWYKKLKMSLDLKLHDGKDMGKIWNNRSHSKITGIKSLYPNKIYYESYSLKNNLYRCQFFCKYSKKIRFETRISNMESGAKYDFSDCDLPDTWVWGR